MRAYRVDREKLERLKEDLAEKATLLYVVDHRLSTRVVHQIH
jgi:hypothetical protein